MAEAEVGVVLLAGGAGSRMGYSLPKQFLLFEGKPVAQHSFDLFVSMPEVKEIVVVCKPEYQHYFPQPLNATSLRFSEPGKERQESAYHGVNALSKEITHVCIHDAARPLLRVAEARQVIEAGLLYGAAALAISVSDTIKEVSSEQWVEKTLDRSRLWAMQTPQVIQRSVLLEAYSYAYKEGMFVTDDVSLLEAIGYPVKLIPGLSSNIKITKPEDLILAKHFYQPRKNTRIGVYGIAYSEGKLLVVAKGTRGIYAGRWDLPGGGVEFGESAEETLHREFIEEVAMDFQSACLWKNLSTLLSIEETHNPGLFHHIGQIYEVRGWSPLPERTPEERYAWMPIEELQEQWLTPFAWEVVRFYQKK